MGDGGDEIFDQARRHAQLDPPQCGTNDKRDRPGGVSSLQRKIYSAKSSVASGGVKQWGILEREVQMLMPPRYARTHST
jgi:hypothetical protein